jgi:uncharacterized damage-inducible protein DinB
MSPDATAPWVAPVPPREEPGTLTDERTALGEWIAYHRATLLSKCAGLTAEQLKRKAVPPSALTLLGIVRHMTIVERWWFRMHAGGEELELLYVSDEWDTADFEDLDDADAEENLAAFESECAAADAALAAKELDDVVPSHGHHPERTRNVRWIYLHMLEEYARHNGHADLLREAIDGTTGD